MAFTNLSRQSPKPRPYGCYQYDYIKLSLNHTLLNKLSNRCHFLLISCTIHIFRRGVLLIGVSTDRHTIHSFWSFFLKMGSFGHHFQTCKKCDNY